MHTTLIEGGNSASREIYNNPILRYMYERHLVAGERMDLIHGHPVADNLMLLSELGNDGIQCNIQDLFNQTHAMQTELLMSFHALLVRTESDQEPPIWQICIKDATSIRDLILIIRLFNRSLIADRLDYLCGMSVDEPYQKPLDLESMRGFTFFIMNNAYLPYPDIVVTPNGHISAEWTVADHGTLVLEFLSSEHVEYLDVFQQSETAHHTQYNSGVSSIDSVTDTVKLAIQNLIHQ